MHHEEGVRMQAAIKFSLAMCLPQLSSDSYTYTNYVPDPIILLNCSQFFSCSDEKSLCS